MKLYKMTIQRPHQNDLTHKIYTKLLKIYLSSFLKLLLLFYFCLIYHSQSLF
jgi:hypothetical protein